jgi:hypothetical protein
MLFHYDASNIVLAARLQLDSPTLIAHRHVGGIADDERKRRLSVDLLFRTRLIELGKNDLAAAVANFNPGWLCKIQHQTLSGAGR